VSSGEVTGLMQHRVHYDRHLNAIVFELEGVATVPGLVEAVNALLAHTDHGPGVDILTDARLLALDHLTASEVWSIASIVQSLSARFGAARTAVVVGRPGDAEVANLFRILVTPHLVMEIAIFLDLDRGRDWLRPDAAAPTPRRLIASRPSRPDREDQIATR
jgi:hypothetical protein